MPMLKFKAENGLCPTVWLGNFLYFIKEDKYDGWELLKRQRIEKTPLKADNLLAATDEAAAQLDAQGIRHDFKTPQGWAGAFVSEERGHTWAVCPVGRDAAPCYVLRKVYKPLFCGIRADNFEDARKRATEYVSKLATENDTVQLSFG